MGGDVQLKTGEGKKLRRPNNIIPIVLDNDFFKWWCIFLRPFCNLTDKEINIVSSFLKIRFELAKIISDETILDSQLMSDATKNRIIEESGITRAHFYVLMSNLRKHGIMTRRGLNPRLIPNIRPDDNGIFQLLILFKEPPQKTNSNQLNKNETVLENDGEKANEESL